LPLNFDNQQPLLRIDDDWLIGSNGADGTLLINNQSGRYRSQSTDALKQLELHLSNMNIKTISTSEVIKR